MRLGLLFIGIELVLRIGPVHSQLAQAFDSYENLLWYDDTRMPSYKMELSTHPGYTFWIIGSSPVETGLDPAVIRAHFDNDLTEHPTIQNYTFSVMTNLSVMAQLADRWMLELDQPKYVVIGISEINFRSNGGDRNQIEDSPLESALIYPNGLEARMAGLLYTRSALIRYAILARNATLIPREQTYRDILPRGGYTELPGTIDCENNAASHLTKPIGLAGNTKVEDGYGRLDQLIQVFQKRNIPVLVATIPIAHCFLDNRYGSLDDYREIYHDPVVNYLRDQGIPVFDLDTAYYELPVEEQNRLFDNGTHPNVAGAKFLSEQLAVSLETWLAQSS